LEQARSEKLAFLFEILERFLFILGIYTFNWLICACKLAMRLDFLVSQPQENKSVIPNLLYSM
jgi:hypothetical protein